MDWLRKTVFRALGRRGPTALAPSERDWLHPSELPSFDGLSTTLAPPRHRAARYIAAILVTAVLVGAAGLATTTHSTPADQPMLAHVAGALGDLPAPIRSVAARTVELTITTPGHVTTVAAMVLPHDLAVTTKTIPRSALVTATMPGHINFAATWVGRDKAMGFTIVHLSIAVPALELAPLPANASVVAVAPLVTSSITSPRFAWANTSLGDPTLHANGVVSYLATQSVSNLDGFVDAVAIDANGRVVAVLSTNHFWYSAQFVARVANIVATGHGCHSSLGVNGTNAQGGGAQIKTVRARGASAGRLAPGDVVIGLNGHDIHTWNTLLTLLYLTPAQSVASISFTRDATTYHTVVRLACSL